MVYSSSKYAADAFCYHSFEAGRELRLFYFSRPVSFFVVGSLFISVSSLSGRKKGRNGIGTLISVEEIKMETEVGLGFVM